MKMHANVNADSLHFDNLILVVIDHFLELLVRDEEVRFLLPVDAYVALHTGPYFVRCHKIPVTALVGYLGLAIRIHLMPFPTDYAHMLTCQTKIYEKRSRFVNLFMHLTLQA